MSSVKRIEIDLSAVFENFTGLQVTMSQPETGYPNPTPETLATISNMNGVLKSSGDRRSLLMDLPGRPVESPVALDNFVIGQIEEHKPGQYRIGNKFFRFG